MTTEKQAKLRIKVGGIELEYEGRTDFLDKELMPTIRTVLKKIESQVAKAVATKEFSEEGAEVSSVSLDDDLLSTNTIATAMNAKSGQDLVLAAMGHLMIVGGGKVVKRHELIADMKTAYRFFKQSSLNNLTFSLNRLSDRNLVRLVDKETYALSQEGYQMMKGILLKAKKEMSEPT